METTAIQRTERAAITAQPLGGFIKRAASAIITSRKLTMRLNCVLGIMAFIAIMLHQATGTHSMLMAALALGWALQGASLLAIDISKKGGEL